MPTRLILVRHGETDGNVEGRTQGRRDVPLNARGRRQAAALAERLRGRPLVAVVSSPSTRCLATAEAIAAPHALAVTTDARLAEIDQGVFEGLTGEEMRRADPAFMARWRAEDPTDLRIPGGESMGEVQRRMVAACEAIAAAWPEGVVAVVSHNLATRAFLCAALDVPLAAFRRIRHELASFAEVERLEGGGWLVTRLNERCHVSAD